MAVPAHVAWLFGEGAIEIMDGQDIDGATFLFLISSILLSALELATRAA